MSSFSQLNAADSEKPRALRVQGGVVIKPQGISARLIIFNYHTKVRLPKIMNNKLCLVSNKLQELTN